MIPSALIAELHGGHAGGIDLGWFGSVGISLLIVLVLAISSRQSRK